MTPEGKFIFGCIAIPVVILIGPLYALALLFAWPVILPLTGLLAWSVWRWNEKAKRRHAQFPELAQQAQAQMHVYAYTPYYEPRIGGHGFLLPGYVAQAWEDGPTSLDD